MGRRRRLSQSETRMRLWKRERHDAGPACQTQSSGRRRRGRAAGGGEELGENVSKEETESARNERDRCNGAKNAFQ